jgi:hypothetical protein
MEKSEAVSCLEIDTATKTHHPSPSCWNHHRLPHKSQSTTVSFIDGSDCNGLVSISFSYQPPPATTLSQPITPIEDRNGKLCVEEEGKRLIVLLFMVLSLPLSRKKCM